MWRTFGDALYIDLEVPQFLREILTRGTRLFEEWTTNSGANLTIRQKMVLPFLRQDSRKLKHSRIHVDVDIYSLELYGQMLSSEEHTNMENILDSERLMGNYDDGNDFPVVRYYIEPYDFPSPGYNNNNNGDWVHQLVPGQEDKIFKNIGHETTHPNKNWFDLSPAGPFDNPACKPFSNGYSPLANLPDEILVKIHRYLFKFDTELTIIYNPNADVKGKYEFIIKRPEHLQDRQFEHILSENYWLAPTTQLFFAFAATDHRNRSLALQIFYKENQIIMHGGMDITGAQHHGTHVRDWLRSIGPQARFLIRN
jgi:hypothetical protein